MRVRIASVTASWWSASARACRVNAGRPFFIWMGTSHASAAPAASSVSSTPGHSRGSRSSTLARSSASPVAGRSAAVSPRTTRTTLGQPTVSLPPAPTPSARTVRPGRGSHRSPARARTSAMPVGVASSPTLPGVVTAAGVSWVWWGWSCAWSRGCAWSWGSAPARSGVGCTCQPRTSSATAGTGTGMSPWAARTRPDPTRTAEAETEVTPSSRSASQAPTTSAIESSAPTSWKCTVSGSTPCVRPSASARRPKAARARSRVCAARSASASIARMLAHVRWGGSSTSTRTRALVARCPPRVTSSVSRRTAPGTTASRAACRAPTSAPASTSAPRTMSPATPAEMSNHACMAAIVLGAHHHDRAFRLTEDVA